MASFNERIQEGRVTLMARLNRSHMFTAMIFLHEGTITRRIFHNTITTAIIGRGLRGSDIQNIRRFARVGLNTRTCLLHVTHASLSPTVRIKGHFETMIANRYSTLIRRFLTLPPPVTN